MKIAAVQLAPGAEKAANIEAARAAIAAAIAGHRPHLVSLPEMWTCLGGDRATKLAEAETLPPGEPGGAAWHFLSETARRHGIVLHGGSIGERDGERLFNTTLVFGPDGAEIARYRKIHLFDVTTPSGEGYRESALFGAGRLPVVCEAGGVRLGLSICYDVRFPELFLALRRAGAELILIPAAFTAETGRDHWETLVRARAIETQCWVVAAATCGTHQDPKGPRRTWGHSLIVDPWGQVHASLGDAPGIAAAEADLGMLARIRGAMPVIEHRVLC